MQRHKFLGAAAAAMSLSAEAAAGDAESNEIVEDKQVSDGGDYIVTECGSVPAGLGDIHVWDETEEKPIDVKAIYSAEGWSGVGIDWSSGPVSIATSLTPEDARGLAERLKVAADAAEGDV